MTNELLINSVSPVSEQIEQAEQTEQTEQTVSNEYVRMARRALDLVDADDAIRENQFTAGVKRSARIGHHMLQMLAQDRASLASHVRFIEHGGAEGFAQYQQRFIDEGKSAPANPYRYSVYSRGVVLARMILSANGHESVADLSVGEMVKLAETLAERYLSEIDGNPSQEGWVSFVKHDGEVVEKAEKAEKAETVADDDARAASIVAILSGCDDAAAVLAQVNAAFNG